MSSPTAGAPRPRSLLPYGIAVVGGPSMVPTLRHGDRILVRYATVIHTGDVVLARRPDRPELVIVKRAARRDADGWWLLGDNPYGSTDSRGFGAVPDELLLGRALLRVGWPPRIPGPPT
jgi:nickel-type superoxide dismutase maturation protease